MSVARRDIVIEHDVAVGLDLDVAVGIDAVDAAHRSDDDGLVIDEIGGLTISPAGSGRRQRQRVHAVGRARKTGIACRAQHQFVGLDGRGAILKYRHRADVGGAAADIDRAVAGTVAEPQRVGSRQGEIVAVGVDAHGATHLLDEQVG